MRSHYLTTFAFTLALGLCAIVSLTYYVDPFGLYRNHSEEALSRIDQFYQMRATKPLRLLDIKTDQVIVGSSRSGRLSPADLGKGAIYNASLPGATPREIRETLEFAHRIRPLRTVYIGWDFDAFLGLTDERRDGFNTDLILASNPLSLFINETIAHKRTLFSFVALKQVQVALSADVADRRASYLSDGSWRRDQIQNIGPFGFSLVSKHQIGELTRKRPTGFSEQEIVRTLEYCYANSIDCRLFLTPVHTFHFEILEAARLLEAWRDWQRKAVEINEKLASEYDREPLPIWAFNAVEAAVTEPIAVPEDINTPWFTDNLHIRPKFGHLILQVMTSDENRDGAIKLNPDNLEQYLSRVDALRESFSKAHRKQVRRLRKAYGIDALAQANG